MNFTPEKRKSLAKWIISIVAACVLIFLVVQNIGTVAAALSWLLDLIAPILIGLAIALIINVPMRFLELHLWPRAKNKILQKSRRTISFLLALIFILGIFVGIILLVIPEVVNALMVIVDSAIEYIDRINGMSDAQLSELPFGGALLNVDWDKLIDTLQNWIKDQGGNIVGTAFGTVTSLLGGLFDFVIAFVFAVYILFSKSILKKQLRRLITAWLPAKFGSWSIHAASVLNTNFRSFIAGQSMEAVILGALCMLGMLLFGFPYAPMVGTLVGVTALIPVIGSFIGAGVGAFMILTVDPLDAVFFLIFIIVLQQFEGNIIYPKVMGSHVNLPGLWLLFAVTVGGGIAGPLGMLLSVPLGATVYQLVKEATKRREQMHDEKKSPADN